MLTDTFYAVYRRFMWNENRMLNLGIGRALAKVSSTVFNISDSISSFLGKKLANQYRNLLRLHRSRTSLSGKDISAIKSILQEAINLGRRGEFTVIPSFFPISATDNCNLECIMCPGHTGMKGPALKLEQAQSIFASLNSNSANFGKPSYLDVTAGEATLNRELHLIFKQFKDQYPKAKISIITNATLPIRGRVKELFEYSDRTTISIDGATQETYERIRCGSRFENVVRNATDIASLKGGNVGIIFVAMDQNIHEMPAMVRLCAEIGAKELTIQGVEKSSTPFLKEGDDMNFDAPPELVKKYLDEAFEEASRLNIIFSPTAGVLSRGNFISTQSPHQGDPVAVKKEAFEALKMCNVPWLVAPRMNHSGDDIVPATACCHMVGNKGLGNLSGEQFKKLTVKELYNSERYWDIRQSILDGTIASNSCRGCQYVGSYQWSQEQIKEIENGITVSKSQ